MYGSLREYIDLLEREGELVRIKACVNPVEEMAEIAAVSYTHLTLPTN